MLNVGGTLRDELLTNGFDAINHWNYADSLRTLHAADGSPLARGARDVAGLL